MKYEGSIGLKSTKMTKHIADVNVLGLFMAEKSTANIQNRQNLRIIL
jgi:hypothetical protein